MALFRHLFIFFVLSAVVVDPMRCKTDKDDVSALNVMLNSMTSHSKLSDWSASGGDPCGQSWQGITCAGSSVTEINLSGFGLTGSMGYQLASLTSVTNFDMSHNNLKGEIPYQLPPNAKQINLAGNAFTGGIPYSISQMKDLKDLNLGNNQLNGELNDYFGKLPNLQKLDLSSNQFSGKLPRSFATLKSLKNLYLQNNQFNGSLDILANLPLSHLNVENNQFKGSIPNKLKDIDDINVDGNSLPGKSKTASHGGGINLTVVAIAGVAITLLILIIVLLALVKRRSSSKMSSVYIEDHVDGSISFTTDSEFDGEKGSYSVDIKALENLPSTGVKSLDMLKPHYEDKSASKFSSTSTDPTTVTAYSLVDLQAATSNFSENLCIGKGTIGCVYKAKFADGKILAVKSIDAMDTSRGSSCNYMEIISSISKLHHPNISKLWGYCSEQGYLLLVDEYQRNGSLHEFLHLSNDFSKPLTWGTRVRITLGTARALEYLHEACSPSWVHKRIKSSNILLDTELNPHLSDCGLAVFDKTTTENQEAGYDAPECTISSCYTMKSDVYSFGVVMLELLTGRKPFDRSKPIAEQSLVLWATPQLRDFGALSQMVDPALRGLYPRKSLSKFADVIALCVQPEPEFRPAMSEIVQTLDLCLPSPSFNKKQPGGDRSSSCRSDDSDYGYY